MRLSGKEPTADATNDDVRLVAAAQRQPVRFAALYDRYFPRVYRYIAQRVGSRQDAEDLTAQVFTEALERLHTYRGQGSFAAWLFGIARHKVTDYYRQREDEVSLESASTQKLASPDTVPEHWAIRNERLRLLARALHTLAPEKQEALALRFFADLKYGEIARILGKREPAVKMMVYRALDELREKMLAAEEGRDAPEG